jgi:hypothetical protein
MAEGRSLPVFRMGDKLQRGMVDAMFGMFAHHRFHGKCGGGRQDVGRRSKDTCGGGKRCLDGRYGSPAAYLTQASEHR